MEHATPDSPSPSRPPRRRLRRRTLLFVVLAMAGGAIAGLGLAAWYAAPRVERAARARLVAELERRFESRVEVGGLDVSLYPQFRQEGTGIVLRFRGREDVPPLISLDRYEARSDWSLLLRRPRRIQHLTVEGLRVVVPPRKPRDRMDNGGCLPVSASGNAETAPGTDGGAADPPSAPAPRVSIDRVTAHGSRLELMPRRADRPPRVFDIHDLTLQRVAANRPLHYRATLTNPKPEGLISTSGQFGPWRSDEPSLTPVSGRYAMADADLSVFSGIAGTLSSDGRFDGVLEQLHVRGDARVPDFRIAVSGNAVPLATRFVACVDGTDGDTYLREVEARFHDTVLEAAGKVEGRAGVKGRAVVLDVRIQRGRVEDLIALAVKGPRPFLTGAVRLRTSFDLPPGEREVADRLRLAGTFQVLGGRFTDTAVQDRIDELSRRGRGDVRRASSGVAPSDFKGTFRLREGVMTFSDLEFAVRGARVKLSGHYALQRETLDFEGTLRLQARVSETTTGFKSLLLKVVDPLFSRKDAGTVLPIRITGTRDRPEFKVEKMKALLRRAR